MVKHVRKLGFSCRFDTLDAEATGDDHNNEKNKLSAWNEPAEDQQADTTVRLSNDPAEQGDHSLDLNSS